MIDDYEKKPSPTSYRNMPNVRDENAIKIKYGRLSGIADEPSSQRLSLNRSQYGDCSSKYNTPAGT